MGVISTSALKLSLKTVIGSWTSSNSWMVHRMTNVDFHAYAKEREFMDALEALTTLLVDVREDRIARRIGVIWLALGDLIGRDASSADKAAMVGTLREVINEPQGLMRLRIHPANAELIDEAMR